MAHVPVHLQSTLNPKSIRMIAVGSSILQKGGIPANQDIYMSRPTGLTDKHMPSVYQWLLKCLKNIAIKY